MKKYEEIMSKLEGEELIYETGLHKWVLIWPALLILPSVVFIIVAAASGPNGFGSMFFWALVFWIAVFLAITARLDYSTAHLYLTNKRIILKAGWMRKVLMEVLLDKVQGIDIDQSFMGRMLNYGVVTIKGIGINNITMKNVREPFEFREIAQKQIQKVAGKTQ
ncbi:MAG: PH domain-containing protein [Caldisericaceae bacterium]